MEIRNQSGIGNIFLCSLKLTHVPGFVWRPMAVGGSHTCYYKNSVTVHGVEPARMEEVGLVLSAGHCSHVACVHAEAGHVSVTCLDTQRKHGEPFFEENMAIIV